jgi:acetolactate synthase-1/3 small subunit
MAEETKSYLEEIRTKQKTVLELTVHNHPGVMCNICGLFARRAFNVEGVLCMPIGNGETSRLWLLLNENQSLQQVEMQLLKLIDVIELKHHGTNHKVFEQMEDFFQG